MEEFQDSKPLSNTERLYGSLAGMGLADGEIVTMEHLVPVIKELVDEQGLKGLEGIDDIVGRPYISRERDAQNVEYLDSFGPRIPFK